MLLLCLILYFPALLQAQYTQNYNYINASIGNGVFQNQFWWRPTDNDVRQQVVNLHPRQVILEYNCFHMKDICKNAENFQSRRQAGNPQGFPTHIFAYDFNGDRRDERRKKSCPSSWKNRHPCPEPDQQDVMRHDGVWPYKDLEPNSGSTIRHKRDAQGNIDEYSGVAYSCDEFPPATWIEGGSGPLVISRGYVTGQPAGLAETRCAAIRCGPKNRPAAVKAEQDWQGLSHARLRDALEAAIGFERRMGRLSSWANNNDNNNGVVFFGFRMINQNSPVAAKVYRVDRFGQSSVDGRVSQAKRSTDDPDLEWFTAGNIEDLRATGNVEEHQIRVDDHMLVGNLESESESTCGGKRRQDHPTKDNHPVPKGRNILHTLGQLRPRSSPPNFGTLNLKDNQTKHPDSNFWIQQILRKEPSHIGEDAEYKVFRNILDYGAVGDGITDDTMAIKRAMIDGNRCLETCHGTTTKNAIVYFPSGRYLVSSSITLPFGTQVIGDATRWPTILASSCFHGLGVLATNQYTGNGLGVDGEDKGLYITSNNFYRQIRNLRIDTTAVPSDRGVAALHYQVAQATSIQNMELVAGHGTEQMGIFAENGNGGTISDVTFIGGAFGIYGGAEQFTAQRLSFHGCAIGVKTVWNWGWLWKSVTMTNVGVGFLLSGEGVTEDGHVGSASFVDSTFTNVTTAIATEALDPEVGSGSPGVLLENVYFNRTNTSVATTDGAPLLIHNGTIQHWALGPVYTPQRDLSTGSNTAKNHTRRPGLTDNSNYFGRAKPQYQDWSVDDFLHVKDFGARGDGVADDTQAFQEALVASQGKILFVDVGSYLLTSTVIVPLGTKVVGEAWSQLVATGSFFQDERNPQPMLKVGMPGNIGSIELQDLIFTNRGPTAGLVAVEWNVRAETPGSAGIWDCHVRIGGATGTELTDVECPVDTSAIRPHCKAGSLMMHITESGSGYFENMWLWAADHMIDDKHPNNPNTSAIPISVYVARGLLIESKAPTWLYGVSSEHASFYQYNFNSAREVFAGMLQSDSPHYQGSSVTKCAFESAIGALPGDLNTTHPNSADEPWALVMRKTADVMISGAVFYSFHSSNREGCASTQSCQKSLVLLEGNYANVQIQQLSTIGAQQMIVEDGNAISALDNLHVLTHPRWSSISIFDVGRNTTEPRNVLIVDSNMWKMKRPRVSCLPPCLIQLPPWTGATRTVNYPIMTVTDGTWKTTIIEPPLTISQWPFEVLTVTQAPNSIGKRAPVESLIPVLAGMKWPGAAFADKNGTASTTTPEQDFPAPSDILQGSFAGPSIVDLPPGAFDTMFTIGDDSSELECSQDDAKCLLEAITDQFAGSPFGPSGPFGQIIPALDPPSGDEEDENEDIRPPCPIQTSTTTSEASPASTEDEDWIPTWEPVPDPQPSPFESGRPSINEVSCNNDGRKTTHERIDNAIKSYCKGLGEDGDILKENFFKEGKFPFDIILGETSALEIVISTQIWEGCQWKFSMDECRKYLLAPIDSCQCGGKDGKRGGMVENNCLTWKIDPNSK